MPLNQPYVWRNVVMGGGGFVDGIVFQPAQKDLIYARTDVGGAYRWDVKNQAWIPLTDWLSPAQNNFAGIESIGLDPSDPGRVYLAAGTYAGGAAAILRSADQGGTFQYAETPFRMGGNTEGRSNGERLAVDPNAGAILFFGSRRDGLWTSPDHGATWARVESFPRVGTVPSVNAPTNTTAAHRRGHGYGGNQPVGIVSVVFDRSSGHPGTPTPVIYAAVSTAGTNLFRSDDAGGHWQAVAGQPVGLRPSHLVQSADGRLYLSYGSAAGPNNENDGAIWKYAPKDGTWTDISPGKSSGGPISWGYGAVAVDAQNPATIMAASIDRWQLHDEVFRSTNAGATWKGILLNGRMDYSEAPYTRRMTPHWIGTLAINPGNPDQVLFGTGYGIWCCTNATLTDAGGQAVWTFLDKGLEETVPLALISPPAGAHLLSGVGDIDGFRHDDLDVSPPAGTFAGPRYGNTEALAFAWGSPRVIVRAGSTGNRVVRAAYSRDGGATWQALAGEPPTGNGAGAIAISADAQTIIWTPRGGAPYFTRDWGVHWTACAGLSRGMRVVADTVDQWRAYAFDAGSGTLYASTNGAASFMARAVVLPAQESNPFAFGGGATVTATPGMADDLWLASPAQGLFHSTNGGASFIKLEPVQEAGSLGLGKAAPGKHFPSLFLAGRIGGLQALFRSDDAGQSWVRINDDRHQYGHISSVTGDPRIYGRVYFATGGRGVIYGEINSYISALRP